MSHARRIASALKTRVMLKSRRRKAEQFYELFLPGMRVLDVGVTAKDGPSRAGPQNYLLKTYPYAPETYTGLGVHDLSGLQNVYPQMRFVTYDGHVMPFDEDEFDWAYSNAVIEHVGGRSEQLQFLNEMLRVARYVFFTTPNKHFPLETHTSVPFLHWNDRLFDKWLWKHKPQWRTHKNLWLLSRGDVLRLLRESTAVDFEIRHNRALLWPMTMTIVASRRGPVPKRDAAYVASTRRIEVRDGAGRAAARSSAAARGRGT